MIEIRDVPESYKKEMIERLHQGNAYRSLNMKYGQAIRNKDYINARHYQQQIVELEEEALTSLARQFSYAQTSLYDIMKRLDERTAYSVNLKMYCIMLYLDMIETLGMDIISDIRKSGDKKLSVPLLDDLKNVGKRMGDICRSMIKNERECGLFAQYADDLTELMNNKAKALMRKIYSKKINGYE